VILVKYVALLRGVNVGGKNKLPMKDLAEMFVAAGCKDVRTYIQSGNVVFSASTALVKKLPDAITKAIEKKFSYKIPVVIRSGEEVANAVRENPFVKKATDVKLLYVSFLAHQPAVEAITGLDTARSAPDAFHVIGREIYLHLPTGAAKTKLTNAYFDSRLKTISTVRNWNTVLTLLELMSD
jgi:uncharacterized protein (DUF1697 family)